MLTATPISSILLVSGDCGNDELKLKLKATSKRTTTTTLSSSIFVLIKFFCLSCLTFWPVLAAQDSWPIRDNGAAAAGPAPDGCFRSAVYQNTFKRFQDCHASVERNLDIYERVAREASGNGARIIVFPEDGLFVGSRRFVAPCLVELPPVGHLSSDDDAHGSLDHDQPPSVNPCKQFETDDNIILKRLSCMASENSLFVVANFATRSDCSSHESDGGSSSACPKEGYFMFNTNVVFDSAGRLIKVYRKFNPFIEVFDGATQLELAYFDTDFGGRFGLFTCFDILYKSPAIDLIEKYHIGTALFPSWWFDKLPIHSAIQYQDAWSMGNGVNLLAANLLEPGRGSVGFGIYSAQSDSIYSGANQPKPRLILANLRSSNNTSLPGGQSECPFDSVVFDVDTDDDRAAIASYKPFGHFELTTNELIVRLNQATDNVSVCLGAICCHLEYELAVDEQQEFRDKLVLIVKDGPSKLFSWWEQTCFLATLVHHFDPSDHFKDVKYSLEDGPDFERLSLEGNFSSKYVMPTGSHNVSHLIDRRARRFDCLEPENTGDHYNHTIVSCKQQLIAATSDPVRVNSFGLYARLFDKDQTKTRPI